MDKASLLRVAETGHTYFFDGRRRRRILHPPVTVYLREKFPGLAIKNIDEAALAKIEPGAIVPRQWSIAEWIEPPDNKQQMREIIVSRLVGKGVEFGAGSRPLPLPVDTSVEYAEPFQSAEQYERMNYDSNTVVAELTNPIEDQHQVEKESLDFVAAAHVIEHTPNPVGAIAQMYERLKPGGTMVLVVPDKRRTFDKDRETTTLEHLVADFEDPSAERDLENYVDFFENAKHAKYPASLEKAKNAQASGQDIHFHVWTPASFHQMMEHICSDIAPFRSFEIKPGIKDPQCLEFYAVATR